MYFFIFLGLPSNEVLPILKEKVTEFKHGMPVITSLRNPSLKARHWQLIERLIQKSIARDKNFTLANLLEMNVRQHWSRQSTIQILFNISTFLGSVSNIFIYSLWLDTTCTLIIVYRFFPPRFSNIRKRFKKSLPRPAMKPHWKLCWRRYEACRI